MNCGTGVTGDQKFLILVSLSGGVPFFMREMKEMRKLCCVKVLFVKQARGVLGPLLADPPRALRGAQVHAWTQSFLQVCGKWEMGDVFSTQEPSVA